jgi:hypothetical protein
MPATILENELLALTSKKTQMMMLQLLENELLALTSKERRKIGQSL